jgi:predicted regulator of amino acid metabolism with ACT domain
MSVSYYKKLIEEKLGRYRSRLPIIKSMLSNGISIDNEGHYRAGPFKIPDSSLAKALNIDRRIVRETAFYILNDEELKKLFMNLTPICSMTKVSGLLGFTSLVITVKDPKKSGIVSNVTNLIAKYGLGIRQIFAEDPELFEEPKLTVVIEGSIPGEFLSELSKFEDVKTITILK